MEFKAHGKSIKLIENKDCWGCEVVSTYVNETFIGSYDVFGIEEVKHNIEADVEFLAEAYC